MDVLVESISHLATATDDRLYIHEVTAGNPRCLITGIERVADDVETSCERGLVHEGDEIHAGASQEDLESDD